jgi:DNA-binding MarR family transcriptional regulator
MVLCSLTKKEKLSSGEIGESLGITSSNASKVIASAEKKGLIKRFLCKEDKRQMLFSITEKGQRADEINRLRRNRPPRLA